MGSAETQGNDLPEATELSESSTRSTLQMHTDVLGALGLIPFLGIPALVMTNHMSLFEAQGLFAQYSAVILSFLGGIHWYDAIKRSQSIIQLYIAMLPSIFAWSAIGFSYGNWTIVVLSVSFGVLLLYDFIQLKMTPDYQRLRIMLTGVVIGCHCFMIWLSI